MDSKYADHIFDTSQEYNRNKRRFTELWAQGEIRDGIWYLIKDGRVFKQSCNKEDVVAEMRKDIKESRNWYLQIGGDNALVLPLSIDGHKCDIDSSCFI